jgi:uncharacterized membrane-anchored protein YhcB (DUF1043 family)
MEFPALISSLNTASIKIWVFVVLLFVSSIALVIIILGLLTRSYNKRKEKKELRKRREVLKARLNELTGKTNDEEIRIGKIQ